MPSHPHELADHECLDYVFANNSPPPIWTFSVGQAVFTVKPAGRMLVNDARALIDAAVNGRGIVMLADSLLEPFVAAGQLVRVLAE